MADNAKYWLDGEPYDRIDVGIDEGQQKYWLDGTPSAGFQSEEPPAPVINYPPPVVTQGRLRW